MTCTSIITLAGATALVVGGLAAAGCGGSGGLNAFGGNWFAVSPAGQHISAPAASSGGGGGGY